MNFSRLLLTLAILANAGTNVEAETIFLSLWNKGQIVAADSGNWLPRTVLSGLVRPLGLDVDAVGQRIYFTQRTSWDSTVAKGLISRASLNGTNTETIATDLGSSFGPAVDATGGKMYWWEFDEQRIRRANLDGTASETLVVSSTAIGRGGSPVLDRDHGNIYWADQSTWSICRASFSGQSPTVLSRAGSSGSCLSADFVAGNLYWSNIHSILSSRLDGTGVRTVLSGLGQVDYLTVDPSNSVMYYSVLTGSSGLSAIYRCNLDGTGNSQVFSVQGQVSGMVVSAVPEPSTCAAALAGLACVGYSLCRRGVRA